MKETIPANRRILVIDDSPSIQADFCKILRRDVDDSAFAALAADVLGLERPKVMGRSYDVDVAGQGDEGVALVQAAFDRQMPYAVAFVDMRMPPGIDGVETIERIWAIDPRIQVVICTAYSDRSWQEVHERLGGSDNLLILKKPFDVEEVVQIARSLTHKWKLSRSIELELVQLEDAVTSRTSELRQAIEDLTTAKARAEQADRSKTLFLANVSHEIRTPLNGVLGMADALLDLQLGEAQRECALAIHQSGTRLLGMLNGLLDLCEIEVGAFDKSQVEFNVASLVQECLRVFMALAAEKQVDLRTDVDASIPLMLAGDVARIRQVLTTLIDNAIKHTDRGAVEVHVTLDARTLWIGVRDTGRGMTPDEESRVRQLLGGKVDQAVHLAEGRGLGLLTTRRLVELLDGELGMTTRSGVGSEFWFTAQVSITEIEPQDRDKFTARALVAEDDAINVKVLRRLLEHAGCQVDVASDGSEALEAVRRRAYDIVLMDCHMPMMDGFEATRAIRAFERHAGRRTVIVAATASAMPEIERACLDAGMDDSLPKPTTKAAVRAMLAKWLR